MNRVTDIIDEAVRGAREAVRRQAVERSSVKEAETQPRSDIARGLRTMASALRDDGGSP